MWSPKGNEVRSANRHVNSKSGAHIRGGEAIAGLGYMHMYTVGSASFRHQIVNWVNSWNASFLLFIRLPSSFGSSGANVFLEILETESDELPRSGVETSI
jgi:hypothetical protein